MVLLLSSLVTNYLNISTLIFLCKYLGVSLVAIYHATWEVQCSAFINIPPPPPPPHHFCLQVSSFYFTFHHCMLGTGRCVHMCGYIYLVVNQYTHAVIYDHYISLNFGPTQIPNTLATASSYELVDMIKEVVSGIYFLRISWLTTTCNLFK